MKKQKTRCPFNGYPKGVINGPDPKTERGKRRRKKRQEEGVVYCTLAEKVRSVKKGK